MKGFALRTSISVRLITPYAKEFVEALKVGIPALAREYEPASRTWVIYSPYEVRAIGIARRYYEEIEIVEADRRAVAPAHATVECLDAIARRRPDHAALRVWPGAPRSVVVAAYRALAREHHPDLAGPARHERMVELNAAYGRLVRSSS